MTYWEQRTNPLRSRPLRILAAGFATLATGCAAVLFRHALPGALGSALSNLLVLSGYLLILGGVASLSGRRYRRGAAAVLLATAAVWVIFGAHWQDVVWNYASSVPIALVSGMTAREMMRCDSMKSLAARHIVVVVTCIHTLVYAARALVLPWVVTEYGPAIQSIASKITIYEGVLYSVILPMALLRLIRDETHGQLVRESQTDYLTRIGNRRWFFEEGARRVDGRERHQPVAVLAFDLDRFKAVNDVHGHQAGDKVLVSFAVIARDVLGPDILLARVGGEEFAALLLDDDARRARVLGESIVTRFAESMTEPDEQPGLAATVSVGLAEFESDTPLLADALAAADRALYRAKALGGNRVESAQRATSSFAG